MSGDETSNWHDLAELIKPFMPNADIAGTYSTGIPAFHADPMEFTIRGPIINRYPQPTPATARQAILHSFETMLTALRANRWVLTSAPRLEFDSYLEPAYWTTTGEVAKPEHEIMVNAKAELWLARCARRRAEHGHVAEPEEV